MTASLAGAVLAVAPVAGHWEREHPGQRWYDGRWELHGDAWVYVEGGWL
ncbi:MAG TPA: hypothetical protein VLX92_15860 [Kofleriaceae bacterium]|nr:hypothetical protein [Kofleriaceae bacterium]